ncbi:UNVERIFIED_CONTAM: MCM2/3/5 family protein [Hammondia hammondi]|eukprot:XP_008883390.1 MCM2/3/5 family protein [Hammondia hammondi]
MAGGTREILSLYFPEEGAQNADLQAYVEEWKTFLYEHRRTLLKHVHPSTLEVFLSYRELLARSPPPSAEACAAALRSSPQDVLDAIACGVHLAVFCARGDQGPSRSAPPQRASRVSSLVLGDTFFGDTCEDSSGGDLFVGGGSEADGASESRRQAPQRRVFIRLLGFGPLTSLSVLRSRQVGSLVAVRGSVLRMYEPRPLVTKLPFLCARCGARIVRKCPEGKVSFPGPCPTPRCASRHFLPQRRAAETVDWQKFSLQSEDARVVLNGCREARSAASALSGGEAGQAEGESRSSAQERNGDHPEPEEKAANEVRRPPSVDCEVRGALVNSCRLGEKVVVVGIVRAYQTCLSLCGGAPVPEAARARAPGPGRSLYTLYLDVVSVASANPEQQRNAMQRVQRTQQAIYAGFPPSLLPLCLDGPLADLSADEVPWRDFAVSQESRSRGPARGRRHDWQKSEKSECATRGTRNRETPPRDFQPTQRSGCTYTSDVVEEGRAASPSAALEGLFPAYPGDPDFEELDSGVAAQHLEFITEIFDEEHRLELLAASLAPHIRGHEIPKAALVLTLLGGVAVYGDSGDGGDTLGDLDPTSVQSFEGRALKRRGSIHLLLLGDAGVGKSRLLRATAEVGSCANAPLSASLLRSLGLQTCRSRAPRELEEEGDDIGPGGSVFVCGNTTSAAGLTASTHREQGTGEFALEAGALVLADGGICCVDELDKMHAASTSADVSALLEAMEHQTVSVVKGSCYCTLPARTAIAAAANPNDGRFIPSKSLAENMKLPHCLTSRFDLILCLHDDGSREGEASVSAAKRHRREEKEPARSRSSPQLSEEPAGQESVSLAERIKGIKPSKRLPLSLLQVYLAYARQYVHPVMTPEAGEALKRLFSFLRRQRESEFAVHDSLPVGMRQLESLIRFCEARARADLVEEVTEEHVRDVGELFFHSAAFSRLAFAATPAAQAEAARLSLHPPGQEHLNGTSAAVAAELVGIVAGTEFRRFLKEVGGRGGVDEKGGQMRRRGSQTPVKLNSLDVGLSEPVATLLRLHAVPKACACRRRGLSGCVVEIFDLDFDCVFERLMYCVLT